MTIQRWKQQINEWIEWKNVCITYFVLFLFCYICSVNPEIRKFVICYFLFSWLFASLFLLSFLLISVVVVVFSFPFIWKMNMYTFVYRWKWRWWKYWIEFLFSLNLLRTWDCWNLDFENYENLACDKRATTFKGKLNKSVALMQKFGLNFIAMQVNKTNPKTKSLPVQIDKFVCDADKRDKINLIKWIRQSGNITKRNPSEPVWIQNIS